MIRSLVVSIREVGYTFSTFRRLISDYLHLQILWFPHKFHGSSKLLFTGIDRVYGNLWGEKDPGGARGSCLPELLVHYL